MGCNHKLIQGDIKSILAIENKALQNVLECATKSGNLSFINTLRNKELISKDSAAYAIQAALHTAAEMCNGSSNHIFTRILDNVEVTAKRLQNFNLKKAINDCLIITNNQDLNCIDILTVKGCDKCLKKLVEYGYTIPFDIANRAIVWADDHSDNNAAKFLNEYIKRHNQFENTQDGSSSGPIKNDLLKIVIQSTLFNQDNEENDSVEDNSINHATKNEALAYQKNTTQLHTFAENGNVNSAGLYLDKIDANERIKEVYYMRNDKERTPFEIGVAKSDVGFVKLLFEKAGAPSNLLKLAIDWAKTNEGIGREKNTFASQEMISLLKKCYKPFKCFCGKRFAWKVYLQNHERTHTGEKLFKCDFTDTNGKPCGKAFAQKSTLTYHERTHTGEKPYKCNFTDTNGKPCGKAFAQKSILTYHKRTYTGEKSYQCDQCPKRFKRKQNLKNHKQGDHINEVFKCVECGQLFKREEYLTKHEQVHKGVRSFKCDECPASFKKEEYLTKHKRVHKRAGQFQCLQCSASFTMRTELTKHKKVHTQNQVGASWQRHDR
nr:C2H2-type zinc finger protein [Cardinium endosymbiont of Sogatella furcifera]